MNTDYTADPRHPWLLFFQPKTVRTVMRIRRAILVLIVASVVLVAPAPLTHQAASNSFTIEQIKSYPFPNELTASATGSRIAWAFNERGARNVWVAEGPDFKARRLTNYENDDGQELTSLSISADGKFVVYVPHHSTARHQRSDSFLHVARAVRPSGRLTAHGSLSFPIVATIHSSVSIQTNQHQLSIYRRQLHVTRARAGHPMESELRLYDVPAVAARLSRCSNNARRHGPSGLPTPPQAMDNNSGRARSRCAARRRTRTAEQTCTGPPLVASSFSPISTAGRIFIRSQKTAASHCC